MMSLTLYLVQYVAKTITRMSSFSVTVAKPLLIHTASTWIPFLWGIGFAMTAKISELWITCALYNLRNVRTILLIVVRVARKGALGPEARLAGREYGRRFGTD